MKKSNLINKLDNKYSSLKTTDIEKIINIFFDKISKSLSNNKKIEIRGFGTFKIKNNKTRQARNPKTGTVINVKEKKSVHFKTGKILHKKINSNEV
tara:strand:- start:436 stop:723 length:288 start_codon:yes stop_codon:yes gene_type:complete